MRRKTPSALRASTEAWHVSGRSTLLLQRASVRGRVLAVADVRRRGADHDPEHQWKFMTVSLHTDTPNAAPARHLGTRSHMDWMADYAVSALASSLSA
jgi:hypothetical protein